MGDKSKVYAGAEDQDTNIKSQPIRIFDIQKKQDGKPVNPKDFEDFNRFKGGEGGATYDVDRAVLYGTPSYLDFYKYPGNKVGFEYIAFGSQGLRFRNACMYNMCSTFSCVCCNDACAGCFGPVAPCINQYHCTFQHYPDCACKKDISTSVTGHNYRSEPKTDVKPDAVLGPDLFKFFEFSRKLAEMSYETSYKQLLVPDGKGSFVNSSPPLYTRAERGYADKYLKTKDGVCQIKPGTMTIWRNHTTVAITCVCTNVPGKDVNDEVITVIFQGTGAGAESLMSISLTDAWYDSISSHTTDFWGSNGENIGRVGIGFYLSYNMIRRQDNATRSMVAYTEGPLEDLQRVSKIPGGGSYLGGGLVEYVKNWALDHKRNDVYIVGHSLGGSMAQICAADLAFGVSNGKDAQGKHIPVFKKITLVTYGSPRALGHELAAMVDKAVTHYRLVNALDPVPQHPLYGTEDPMGLTASLNAGYNNFNLGYHRMNQTKTTYEDPYVKKCNAKFERKRSQIEEAAGLLGGQKSQREIARLKSRRPKDVNSGKFLSITRHFGRVFYAEPVPIEKLTSGAIPVVWREMDFDDFCGDNEKLKRVMKDKTKEYDGVVRKVDNFDGLDATGKKTLDPKRVVTPYSDSTCYGLYKRTVEYDEEDERYFRTTDACTGGCLKNSLAAKPVPIEIDLEKTKVLSCGEKTGVCVIRCLEESVDNFLDIIEFMNELPYWCRALNYMIPCCCKCTLHSVALLSRDLTSLAPSLSLSLSLSRHQSLFASKSSACVVSPRALSLAAASAACAVRTCSAPLVSPEEFPTLARLIRTVWVTQFSWTPSSTILPTPATRCASSGTRRRWGRVIPSRLSAPARRYSAMRCCFMHGSV